MPGWEREQALFCFQAGRELTIFVLIINSNSVCSSLEY